MPGQKTSYEKPTPITITCDGTNTTYWRFASLPTFKELQRNTPNIVRAQDKLRPLLEKNLITALIDLEWQQQHDYLHHRGSGLDRVLGKILAQHNVLIIVDMQKFLQTDKLTQATLLGRILQNKRIAKKCKMTMVVLLQNPLRFEHIDNVF